ncbi:Rab proteins geranylgeranyltransferase component A [Myotisia sp. PD_48]|nr:Rab proteins geranylgeranyltransferase component A [Myotisia sp. PD_48]
MLDSNTLNETSWDVVISGTGLPQSLLALALSKSGLKVLHVDKNAYYGGPDAAFSLQEAEEWVSEVNQASNSMPFESASIWKPALQEGEQDSLSSSRSYTLSLSPHLIYSRSNLIPTLVSSKVYRQLEFQAVGSWWVYSSKPEEDSDPSGSVARVLRVPSSREDVFADDTMSMKSKRSLMKILRYMLQQEQDDSNETDDSVPDIPFWDFLQTEFQVPPGLFDALISLSVSLQSPVTIPAKDAISKIKRHLTSMGVFGSGFGAVINKWGGGAELAQVACRACAVGGGVYALGKEIQTIQIDPGGESETQLQIRFTDHETARCKFLVGSAWDLPQEVRPKPTTPLSKISRTIAIVNSPLEALFPPTAENGPIPAGAVVYVPNAETTTPIYLLIHSSDTGECPVGQSVIYGYVSVSMDIGRGALEQAVTNVLTSTDPRAKVIWSVSFSQSGQLNEKVTPPSNAISSINIDGADGRVFSFPIPNLDLAFDDDVIEQVRHVWDAVLSTEADFLVFKDQEGFTDDE